MPRLIRPDELDALLDLYRILHPDDPVCTDAAALESLWQELLADPNLFCIVHEEDGMPVSSCTLAIIKNLTRGLRPYGVIENVVTHPDYRNRGYGTQVLHEAVRIARERCCYKVMLATGVKDEGTLRFYEDAGFSRGVKTGLVVYF
jgi:ribosomal protein S18 acetylase RimI-like enzyme